MNTSKSKQAAPAKVDTPFLEWLLGSIGVVLLLACVVFLVYEGLNRDEHPGAVTAEVKEIYDVGGSHVVTFTLQNAGSQTMSNVKLSARILDGAREVERVQTVIDYLPGHSSREGGFYFENDPRSLKIEIKPEGYQEP